MALTDTLKLIITGDSTSAQAAFKKAGASAKESMGQAATGADKINTALSVLGPAAIAAGAATVAFGQKSINTYKDVGTEVLKLQRYTGGTAEETSKLRFAAQQSGVSVDQLAVALGRASKNLETAPEKFDKYGIATKDAAGNTLSMHDILLNAAAVFERMPNGAQKTAIALQLFGKSGADLIPLLNRGADGIAELEKQTDKYGQLLSGKNLQDIKDSKMAQRELTAAVQGLQVELGKRLLPAVTDSTKALAGFAKVLTQIPDAFDRVNDSSSGWYSTLLKASPGIVGQALQAKDLSDKIGDVASSSDDAGAAQAAMTEDTTGAAVALTDASEAAATYSDAMKRVSDELRAQFDPLFAVMDAQQNLNELQTSGTASAEDLAKAQLDVEVASRTLAGGVRDGTVSLDQSKRSLDSWVASGVITRAQADELANKFLALTGAVNDLDGRKVLITLISQWREEGVRPGAINAELQGRASGGPVQRGQSYIVGEHRPEIFTPTQNGYIHPSVNAGNVTVFVGGEQVSAVVTNSQRYDARGRR